MKQTSGRRARRSLAAAAIVGCGWLAAVWTSEPAQAQVGGYSQVTRLEIKHHLADGSIEARFHLASGIAVTQRIEGEKAVERLFQTAQAFSGENSRLFATVEDDKVVAWTLSVP